MKPESQRKETDIFLLISCLLADFVSCCLSSSPAERQKLPVSVPGSGPLCSNRAMSRTHSPESEINFVRALF